MLFLIEAFSVSTIGAQALAPPRFPLDVVPKPTLKSAPSSTITLGPLKVTFDKTTLDEIRTEIGVGRIEHQDDAVESSYWLCYSVVGSGPKEKVWFLSHGEMGGPDHVIHGIAARALSDSSSVDTCSDLPQKFRTLSLDSGIWLGTTSTAIRKKLGEPSLSRDSWLHYESLRELRGDPRAKEWGADTFYEYGGFSVRIRGGIAVELWATLSTAG